ncbi:hypothetical protein CTI12_AA615180 [Artemisia annua]|uniref:Uncharacterized protein n=1 Tax=Artemisia annua TaxID=35608 RepID=A0A2U1KDN6_ARTAN|nr:hypothetical protein CTI12_AA615180 [Artemisia annua]
MWYLQGHNKRSCSARVQGVGTSQSGPSVDGTRTASTSKTGKKTTSTSKPATQPSQAVPSQGVPSEAASQPATQPSGSQQASQPRVKRILNLRFSATIPSKACCSPFLVLSKPGIIVIARAHIGGSTQRKKNTTWYLGASLKMTTRV